MRAYNHSTMNFRHAINISILVAALCILLASSLCAGVPEYVWWEAENAVRSDFGRWSMNAEQSGRLSGGAWVSPGGPGSSALYSVSVPSGGEYNLWCRKFWKHGPFTWRFGKNGTWRKCGRDIALHDSTYLKKFIGANWVFLGQVRLSRGRHRFEVNMEGKGGAFDCFLLIKGPFIPRGTLKPGEKPNVSKRGWFAWHPDADPLSEQCPIDLRSLNEQEAGISGFVKRKGSGFILGNGTPVGFWTVQGDSLLSMRNTMIDFRARRLAKYGVNLVRLNMLGMFKEWKAGNTAEFKRRLDRVHYTVSALKKQGIYCYIGHVFWHTHVRISEKDGFPGYGSGVEPIMLLFFDPKMQELYRKWVDALMNTKNPYTGLPMSEDPGAAFFEIQNESSLLFWTFNPKKTPEPTKALMEKKFCAWVQARYGSVGRAYKEWNNAGRDKDAPRRGRLSLLQIWFLTQDGVRKAAAYRKRASDQLRFMVEHQKAFYADMIRDLRKKLGFRNCITCSNWKTADPRTLGILEQYTYTPGDAVCRNVYYGVRYDPKPKRFYAVDTGDTYIESSGLNAGHIPAPLTITHLDSHPYMITENNWTRPSRFRAEWPFLAAACGSVAGVDAWTFFALDTPVWVSRMNVWDVSSPSILGQFPAAALAFRRGYVEEAEPVCTETLSLADLYEFKGSVLFELSGRDALWTARIGDKEGGGGHRLKADSRAFIAGRIIRRVGGKTSRSVSPALNTYINESKKRITSSTGELEWDYGNGIVTLHAPRAQGACGFLSRRKRIRLKEISIECSNEYASILAVSLDGKPLASSGRILVQTATEDIPFGFRTEKSGKKKTITALGGYPLIVRSIKAHIVIKRPLTGLKADILDYNGSLTDRRAQTVKAGAGTRIQLPEQSLYLYIH